MSLLCCLIGGTESWTSHQLLASELLFGTAIGATANMGTKSWEHYKIKALFSDDQSVVYIFKVSDGSMTCTYLSLYKCDCSLNKSYLYLKSIFLF